LHKLGVEIHRSLGNLQNTKFELLKGLIPKHIPKAVLTASGQSLKTSLRFSADLSDTDFF